MIIIYTFLLTSRPAIYCQKTCFLSAPVSARKLLYTNQSWHELITPVQIRNFQFDKSSIFITEVLCFIHKHCDQHLSKPVYNEH